MSGTPLRAGIAGCGRKAATLDEEERCRINYSIPPDAHASAYQQVSGAALVAAADPNAAKREYMQARWGVPAVYDDYRDMLAREDLDLLSVTTRAPQHAPVTIAAAAAGVRGVLCEKAMAGSLREADEMIEACARAGTKLLINHTRRWHPTFAAAAEFVRTGAIGTLRCIVGVCPGPLVHNGTHLFDLMRFFGGDVAWVSGEVLPSAAVDASGRAVLGFQNGVVGFVDLDSPLGLSIELQGTSGRLFIDQAEEGLTIWEYHESPPAASRREWYQGTRCRERTGRQWQPRAETGTLVAAIEELIGCVEHDREGRSSGRDGRAALELALAVYHSHERGGMRVMLPLEDRSLVVPSR